MSSGTVLIEPASEASSAHVAIFDETGKELVYWDEAEWVEDPSVTTAIANAIKIFYTEGPRGVRERLEWARHG